MFEEMRAEAVDLGGRIVSIEQEIDDAFADTRMTSDLLREKIMESAELYGRLRYVHLETHLSMVQILTPDQVELYNELRGYTGGDPAGHDPSKHNHG